MSSSDIAAEARDRELSTSLQHSVQSLSDWLARFGECSSQALGSHALRPLAGREPLPAEGSARRQVMPCWDFPVPCMAAKVMHVLSGPCGPDI